MPSYSTIGKRKKKKQMMKTAKTVLTFTLDCFALQPSHYPWLSAGAQPPYQNTGLDSARLAHDFIRLSCLWQAIIYSYHLPQFSSPLRQIQAQLYIWLISPGIWANKHSLGRLCQLPITFKAFYTHLLMTLHRDFQGLINTAQRISAQAINLPTYWISESIISSFHN